jgi:hypothetical protein
MVWGPPCGCWEPNSSLQQVLLTAEPLPQPVFPCRAPPPSSPRLPGGWLLPAPDPGLSISALVENLEPDSQHSWTILPHQSSPLCPRACCPWPAEGASNKADLRRCVLKEGGAKLSENSSPNPGFVPLAVCWGFRDFSNVGLMRHSTDNLKEGGRVWGPKAETAPPAHSGHKEPDVVAPIPEISAREGQEDQESKAILVHTDLGQTGLQETLS